MNAASENPKTEPQMNTDKHGWARGFRTMSQEDITPDAWIEVPKVKSGGKIEPADKHRHYGCGVLALSVSICVYLWFRLIDAKLITAKIGLVARREYQLLFRLNYCWGGVESEKGTRKTEDVSLDPRYHPHSAWLVTAKLVTAKLS